MGACPPKARRSQRNIQSLTQGLASSSLGMHDGPQMNPVLYPWTVTLGQPSLALGKEHRDRDDSPAPCKALQERRGLRLTPT
jgi:hypothetical protein